MKVGICNTNHFIFIDDGRADDRGVDGITRVVRTNTNIDFILLQFFYNLRIIDNLQIYESVCQDNDDGNYSQVQVSS